MNTEMENQILQGIIEDTRTKLNHSDTDLNILDLLQTYDYYIKQNKVSINTKTKVYKNLLKWSRENLQGTSSSESNSTSNEALNSDLEFEFRGNSTCDKEIKITINDKVEASPIRDSSAPSSKQYQPNRRTKLPKLTFDSLIESKSSLSYANNTSKNIEKPPIVKKIKNSKMIKSSEKPLKNTPSGYGGGRCSTLGSSENNGGGLTPNFRKRGIEIENLMSPYINKGDPITNRGTSYSNDRDSFDNRHKSSEPRGKDRFSELIESIDSEDYKQNMRESYISTQNERQASEFHHQRSLIRGWKSLLLNTMAKMQEQVLSKMANSHHQKHMVENAFRGLIMNMQSGLIERLERAKGHELYRVRMLRK